MLKRIIKKWLTSCRVALGRLNGAKISVKKNTYIAAGTYFSSRRIVSIGSNSYIGRNVCLGCHLDIGNEVLIASNVAFVGGDHRIDNIRTSIIASGRDEIKKIYIEDNVWVGHGAIVLHGVTLHSGCVVAAGAVVTKDVMADTIVAGNPAKFIRNRKFERA